jgi:hypothetical protein
MNAQIPSPVTHPSLSLQPNPHRPTCLLVSCPLNSRKFFSHKARGQTFQVNMLAEPCSLWRLLPSLPLPASWGCMCSWLVATSLLPLHMAFSVCLLFFFSSLSFSLVVLEFEFRALCLLTGALPLELCLQPFLFFLLKRHFRFRVYTSKVRWSPLRSLT